MTRPIPIQDAEEKPWQAPRKPDPTPAELRLGTAARQFAATADAVEQHHGPRSGPAYIAKLDARNAAWTALLEASWGFPAGTEPRTFETTPEEA